MAIVTVRGIYKDGKVKRAELPENVAPATPVLVTFIPPEGLAEPAAPA